MLSHEHVDSLADDDLLRNIVQGCTDCFALLFHRYCRQVFSVSFRIIRDKAETEDILQEVFLSIYLQQERYDASRGSIRTWILQFAYFKSLLRRRYLRIRHFYNDEELSESREMRGSETSDLLGMSSAEWARYVETGIATLGEGSYLPPGRTLAARLPHRDCRLRRLSDQIPKEAAVPLPGRSDPPAE